MTVRGIYKDDALLTGGIITQTLLQRLTHMSGAQVVLATLDPGSNPEQVAKLATDRLAAQFPTAELQSNAEFKDSIGDQVNQLLYLIYALLGVSVLISVFGIVNTLHAVGPRAHARDRHAARDRHHAPPVAAHDPLRERDHGRDRQPARARHRLAFGWIVTKGLESEGLTFAVPWGTLIVCLIVAAIVGVLAGVWPAYRASRMRVLDALSYE